MEEPSQQRELKQEDQDIVGLIEIVMDRDQHVSFRVNGQLNLVEQLGMLDVVRIMIGKKIKSMMEEAPSQLRSPGLLIPGEGGHA